MTRARAALAAKYRSSSALRSSKSARTLIISALQPGSPLRLKMERCGTRYPETDKRYDCLRPACPVCSPRKANRYFRKILWPAFQTVNAADIRWITIVTGVATDIETGGVEMESHHRALRHIAKTLAPRRQIRVFGAKEIDVYNSEDWSRLSPTKQTLLSALGFPLKHVGPVFVLHIHALVDLDGMPPIRLEQRLRKKWPHHRQVHITALRSNRARAPI